MPFVLNAWVCSTRRAGDASTSHDAADIEGLQKELDALRAEGAAQGRRTAELEALLLDKGGELQGACDRAQQMEGGLAALARELTAEHRRLVTLENAAGSQSECEKVLMTLVETKDRGPCD